MDEFPSFFKAPFQGDVWQNYPKQKKGHPGHLPKPVKICKNVHHAWRIIPVGKWLITMVSKSPKWGYSPYKWPKWLINGGYYLLTKWDDPPSAA